MAATITWGPQDIANFLKADPFSEKVRARLPNYRKPVELISRGTFFNRIYADVIDDSIQTLNEDRLPYQKIKLSEWQGILGNTDNSLVVFIEGYAGCGKSVFVQYLLKSQLKTFDYDNEYYNYDLGAYFLNSKSNRIKDAIFESFLDQLATCVIQGKLDIIEKFKNILSSKYIGDLDTSRQIFYKFSTTEIFDKAVNLLFENRLIDNKEDQNRIIGTFRITLEKQLASFSIEQVLAVDYLFRIARYMINPEQRILYVCYDNMDAIENFNDLLKFDKTIIAMRRNIDIFINDAFADMEMEAPRFVILATYRKITASKMKISYRAERAEDFGNEDKDYVYYIDGSCFYHYEDFIKNRRDYFSSYVRENNISAQSLMDRLNMAVGLSKIDFVKKRYSGLWNNNYRACSEIIKALIENYEKEIERCFILLEENVDGYDEETYAYRGASSIFLNLICRTFLNRGLWGRDHMALVPLSDFAPDESTPTSSLTTLSRLLLTYICNSKDDQGINLPVSTAEIFDEFKDLFSADEICSCLEKMLLRDHTYTWRRPIYYHCNAIADNKNIFDSLKEQWNDYIINNKDRQYSEFLPCECGRTYLEQIATDFEFFSVRYYDSTVESIYLLDDADKIKSILDDIQRAVEMCCRRMVVFCERYKKVKGIESNNEYVSCLIHPRTLHNNPQLHTERMIFSHIAYLDYCRLYFVSKMPYYEKKKDANSLFLNAIEKYLEMYNEYIKPINPNRENIAKELENIVERLLSSSDEYDWLRVVRCVGGRG